MIYVGLDDTDMPDTPGTNQLARFLVQSLAGKWRGRLITRHQLLEDPRVPCTRKNGCVAIALDTATAVPLDAMADEISSLMQAWCPAGSDPGLCIAAEDIPWPISEFGRQCQRELVRQEQARLLADSHGILLRGLGGTQDGVIGALAAVGLIHTRDDGRVIYNGDAQVDHFHVSGIHEIARLRDFGIDRVQRLDNQQLVHEGTVDLGKRLRPNYRSGKVVLFVTPGQGEGSDWFAERVL